MGDCICVQADYLMGRFDPDCPRHGSRRRDAIEFLNGWVSGYMARGGELTDEGLADKAVAAHRRRLTPLPEPVAIELDKAIEAAKAAQSVAPKEDGS